jgi:hypothetical protein
MRLLMRDLTVAVVAVALLTGTALAGPKDDKKKSDDGKGPQTIVLRVDASKLPADVLKQLIAAAAATKPGGDKKPAGDKKPGGGKKPGEAKKPTDDKKPGGGKKPGEAKKPTGDKKPGDGKKPGEAKKPTDDKKPGAKIQVSRAEAIAAAEKLLDFLKSQESGAGDKGGSKKGEGDTKPGQKGKKKK